MQEVHEEIYQKTVKNKTKTKYLRFYYTLCEVEEKEKNESNESCD